MWLDHIQGLKDDILLWLSRPTPDIGSQNVDALSSAVATAKGNSRDENQDCALAVHYCSERHGPAVTAFIVCDGIGGMRDGGTCARLGAAMFVASLVGHRFEKGLSRAIRSARAANHEVFERYKEDGGTTLSCLVFQAGEDVAALNVGDSRIYRFGMDGVSQLTVDDTIASQMKQLRPSDASISSPSFGKQLTQFIGMGSDVEFRHVQMQKEKLDDRGFLLTSDGVHSMNAETLRDITVCAATPLDVVKRLTTIARWGKANDNGSAICVFKLEELLPRALSSAWERLLIWDSHSRLDVLLDTRVWEKERRGGKTANIKRSKGRKMTRDQRDNSPDLHGGAEQRNASGSDPRNRGSGPLEPGNGAGDRGDVRQTEEPLQLEIVEPPDDKPAD